MDCCLTTERQQLTRRDAFFQLFRLLLIRAKVQIYIEDLILVQDERWRRG